ncbi:MAG: hypothetical protein IPH49_06690 [Ignavibacteria bacterium]|nr:hypothetical protein [Ignavibacteria bacterium]
MKPHNTGSLPRSLAFGETSDRIRCIRRSAISSNCRLSSETIQQNRETYRTSLPQTLTGVDLEKRQLMFNATPADERVYRSYVRTIELGCAVRKELTDEGVAMFEFVHQSLSLDPVGIMHSIATRVCVRSDHRENLIMF